MGTVDMQKLNKTIGDWVWLYVSQLGTVGQIPLFYVGFWCMVTGSSTLKYRSYQASCDISMYQPSKQFSKYILSKVLVFFSVHRFKQKPVYVFSLYTDIFELV